jgi:coenzyme PQQ synthesis protein D (PqqD)
MLDVPVRSVSEWREGSLPRRSDAVAAQRASDVVVLLSLESGRYFGLEGVADRIWELCDGDHTLADIVIAVSSQYHVDPAIVRADAIEFLDQLTAERLVGRAA